MGLFLNSTLSQPPPLQPERPPTPPPAPPPAPPTSVVKSASAGAALGGFASVLPSWRRPASMPPSPLARPRSAPVGCGYQNEVNTVLVASDLYGDVGQLDSILGKAAGVMKYAQNAPNTLCLAFLGDCWPTAGKVEGPEDDMGRKLLKLKREGLFEKEHGYFVRSGSVHIVLGGRELRVLRLLEVDGGEIATSSVDAMRNALMTSAPLLGATQAYDDGFDKLVSLLAGRYHKDLSSPNLLKRMMWLKLQFLASVGLGFGYVDDESPGFVRNAIAAACEMPPDEKMVKFLDDDAMRCPSGASSDWLVNAVEGLELPAGCSDLPDDDMKAVCEEALRLFGLYVTEVAKDLLTLSELVGRIAAPVGLPEDRGLWLLHAGTGTGSGLESDSIVRRLPNDAKVEDGAVTVEWGEPSPPTWRSLAFWQEQLNNLVVDAMVGKPQQRQTAQRVLAALSMSKSGSGPTQSHDPNPLAGLEPGDGLHPACGAVGHCSHPFAFSERAIEIGEAVKTTASWLRVDVSGHDQARLAWGVGSWCSKMQSKLRPDTPPAIDRGLWRFKKRNEDVQLVSRTLASMEEVAGNAGLLNLRGVLGPVVQVDNEEPLRVVYWTLGGPKEQRTSLAVCLLPEGYFHKITAFREYMGAVRPPNADWFWVGVGFTELVLRNEDKVWPTDEAGDDPDGETRVWRSVERVVGAGGGGAARRRSLGQLRGTCSFGRSVGGSACGVALLARAWRGWRLFAHARRWALWGPGRASAGVGGLNLILA